MTNGGEIRMRRDGVALWRQIADVLREEIERGVHAAGARLPSEMALGERFSVNRHTVRQALQELSQQGLVSAERGRGTIVTAAPLDYPIRHRTRFSEIVSAQAREPQGRLLGSSEGPAPPEVAATLGVQEGFPVVRLETLSLADGEPVGIATHWFDAARFRDLPVHFAESGSVTKALRTCGVEDYVRRSTRVMARSAGPEEASLLALRVGAPLLITEAVNADPGGATTHFTRARFSADRVQLVVSEHD